MNQHSIEFWLKYPIQIEYECAVTGSGNHDQGRKQVTTCETREEELWARTTASRDEGQRNIIVRKGEFSRITGV